MGLNITGKLAIFRKSLLIIFVLLLFAGCANAADYYVSNAGDNANDGSSGSPWKTITYAATTAATASTINVAAGRYSTTEGEVFPIRFNANSNIRLLSTSTWLATIDAFGAAVHNIQINSASITIEGFDIRKTVTGSYYNVYILHNNAGVINNKITGNSWYQIVLTAGCTGLTIRGNNSLNTSATNSFFLLSGGGAAHNGLVENNYIKADRGILWLYDSNNIIIRNNTVESYSNTTSSQTGIFLNGTGVVCSNEVRNMLGTGLSQTGGIYLIATSEGRTIDVFNNTVVNCYYGLNIAAAALGTSVINIKNNIFAATAAPAVIRAGSIGLLNQATSGGTVNSSYNTIYNYATNYSPGGGFLLKTSDDTVCPRFTNTTLNDYRLGTDSTCLTSGDGGTYRGAYPSSGAHSETQVEGYVSNSGNDTTGDGSIGNPWKTITKGLTRTESILYVRGGTYNAANGETFPIRLYGPSAPILKGYPTEAATIDSVAASFVTVAMNANSTIDGVTINNTNTNTGYNVSVETNATNVCILNSTLTGTGLRSIYVNGGAHSLIVRGNRIINTNNSNNAGVYFPAIASNNFKIENNYIKANIGVYMVDAVFSGYSIANNTIEAYSTNASAGLCILRSGTVSGNTISGYVYDNTNMGGIVINGSSSYLTIKNNTVVKNLYGIAVNQSLNTIVATLESNIISACPRPGIGPYLYSTTANTSVGIRNLSGVTLYSYNNQLYNNRTDISGSINQMGGDLYTCPRFMNPDAADYRLGTDSPCVSSGRDGGNRGAWGASDTTSGILSAGYVSPGGNDSNDGTEGHEWKTLAKALSKTDGICYLRAGTYNTANGDTFPVTLAKGQWIKGYAGEVATIDSASDATKDTAILFMSSTIEGITLKNTMADGSNYFAANIWGANANLINCVISSGGTRVICIKGSSTNAIIRGNDIRSIRTGRADIYFDSSGSSSGVLIANNYLLGDIGTEMGNNMSNTTISNNTVEAFSSTTLYGISISGSGLINGNTVSGYSRDATNYAGIIVYTNNSYVTIKNNTVINNLNGIAVNANLASNVVVTVESNIIAAKARPGLMFNSSCAINNRSPMKVYSYNNQIYDNEWEYGSNPIDLMGGDLYTCPRFVNPDAKDYRLSSDSPCINSGRDSGNRGAWASAATSSGILSETYVDAVNGSDSNDGSFGSPFKTVKKGLSKNEGICYLRAGTYNAANGDTFPIELAKYQWLKGYQTEVATIDSANTTADEVCLFTLTTIEGITLKNTLGAGNLYYNVDLWGYGNQVINCIVYGTGNRSVFLQPSSNNAVIKGNTIYNTVTNDNAGIRTDSTGSSNILIDNNYIKADYGVQLAASCSNFTITNNTIESNTTAGSKRGILIKGTGVIRYNQIRKYYGTNIYESAINVEANNSVATVENNTIVDNYHGITTSTGLSNTTIFAKDNIISAAPKPGTYFSGSFAFRNGSGTINSTYNQIYNTDNEYGGSISLKTQDAYDCPRFMNPTTNDYRLGTNSPCLTTSSTGSYRGAYGSSGVPSAVQVTGYVDDDGDDANDGSEEHPWKTIACAVGLAEKTVIVRAGTYNAASGNTTWPITLSRNQWLKAYTGEAATIDSAGTAANTIVMYLNTTVEGLAVTNAHASSAAIYGIASNTQVKNNTLTAANTPLYYASGANSPIISGNRIVCTGAQKYAAQFLASTNIVFNNNWVTSDTAIYLPGASTPVTITNNTIEAKSADSTNARYAVYTTAACNNITISSNEISGYYNSGFGAICAASTAINGFTVRGNHIVSDFGVNFNIGVSNILIVNNTIEAKVTSTANAYGVQFGNNSCSGTITGNLIKNYLGTNGCAVLLSGGLATAAITKNTFVDNLIGVYSSSGNNNTTATIKNNIISASPKLGTFVVGAYGIKCDSSYSPVLNSTYNQYFNNNYNYGGSKPAQIQQKTNDVDSCPRFVNSDTRDYRLCVDSPCRTNADDSLQRGAYPTAETSSGILTEAYIDTAGDDSTGTGAIDMPWKTVNKALSMTEGKVFLRAGNYNAASGNSSWPMKMSNKQWLSLFESEIATIDCGSAGTAIQMANYCTVEGLTVKSTATGASDLLNVYGTDVNILNNTIFSPIGCIINLRAGTDRAVIRGNDITASSNAKCGLTLGGAANQVLDKNHIVADCGIYISGTCTGLSITSNTIETAHADANSQYAIGVYPNGVTGSFTGNEIRGYLNATYGSIYLAAGLNSLTINKNTFVKNIIGIVAPSGANASTYTIRDNIFSASPKPGTFWSGSYGIKCDTTFTPVLNSTYNQFYNNETDYGGSKTAQILLRTNDSFSCPHFMNTDTNDYRLGSDSPCLTSASDGGVRGAYANSGSSSNVLGIGYVSTTGDDTTGDGSIGNPWKTINKGLNYSDLLYVKGGTYNAAQGTSFPLYVTYGQQLKGYPTEVATIDSENAAQDTIRTFSYATIEGLYLKSTNTSKNNIYITGSYVQVINNYTLGVNGIYLISGANYPYIYWNNLNNTTANYILLNFQNSTSPIVKNNRIVSDKAINIANSTGMLISFNTIEAKSTDTNATYGINIVAGTGAISSNEVRGFRNATNGGITASGGTYSISNSTIVKNFNGINTTNAAANLTILNCIIASEVGGYTASSTIGLKKTAGTLTSTYTDVFACDTAYSGGSAGTGDIASDPKFRDATNNDYTLLSTSPCITGGQGSTYMGAYPFVALITRVGTAANWSWQAVTGGNVIPSGTPNSWSWQSWSENSGRKAPHGPAGSWIWRNE